MRTLRRVVTLPAHPRAKWAFLVAWIVIFAIAAPLASQLADVEENQASAYLPDNAESTRALDLQDRFTPEDTITAVIVYERDSGITPEDQQVAQQDFSEILTRDYVVADEPTAPPIPPQQSADSKAMQAIFTMDAEDGFQLGDDVKDLRSIVQSDNGLTAFVTGPAGTQGDLIDAFGDIDSRLLGTTLLVVIFILLIVYRSPLLWLIPVISAIVALQLAQGTNYLAAKYADLTVNGQSAGILLVLVFGAGTDYALLLVARYREELRNHEDKHEAMAFALRRTGPAVVASAVTVILALLCLLLSDLNSNSGLGPVAAIGIACALLSMMTLLPTLLVIFGRRLFWPFIPHFQSDVHAGTGMWARIGSWVSRRYRTVAVVTSLALGVMCLGLFTLEASGQTNAQSFTGTPDSVRGERILTEHFSAGSGDPAVVIGNASQAAALRDAVTTTPGVVGIQSEQTADDLVQIEATLGAEPNSPQAYDTIDRLRDRVHAIPQAQALVGGNNAVNVDVQRAAARDRDLIIPVVLVVVFLVLAVLLRALIAPLLLIATVVLSYGAALGVSALVYEYIFDFEGADAALPMFVFIFLVALGIDYNIFLMTRVHEETATRGTWEGTLRGLAVTGGVITSAGIILAATFSVLGVLPLVFLAQLGFAVAFGVLLDTLIVRSVLVPAFTLWLNDHVWWPSRLSRGTRRNVPSETGGHET